MSACPSPGITILSSMAFTVSVLSLAYPESTMLFIMAARGALSPGDLDMYTMRYRSAVHQLLLLRSCATLHGAHCFLAERANERRRTGSGKLSIGSKKAVVAD